jgi:hypothetical protein
MLINRKNSVAAVGILVLLLEGSLQAQNLEEVKLFTPSDLSLYGSGPQPNQGYFFGFDGLFWSLSRPDVVQIGFPNHSRLVYYNAGTPPVTGVIPPWPGTDPTTQVQTNSQDTGPLNADFTEGNRIEFGRVYGRDGWLFSTYRRNDQTQQFQAESAAVAFNDPDGLLEGYVGTLLGYTDDTAVYIISAIPVPLPVVFDDLLVENRVTSWGVELMYLHRSRQTHRGGFFELFAGVRYLEFDETFRVDGLGRERFNSDSPPEVVRGPANARFIFDLGPDTDPTNTNWNVLGPGVVLADSFWTAEAENHIIGPQIGGRWFRKGGRWTLSAEGRFFAGLNMQNVHSQGILGTYLNAPSPWRWDATTVPGLEIFMPLLRDPIDFDHKAHFQEWSPGGELRAELIFEVTRAISVKVGWTGMWLGGIARASAMPDYIISNQSTMGIRGGKANQQYLFVNGLNVGLTINR